MTRRSAALSIFRTGKNRRERKRRDPSENNNKAIPGLGHGPSQLHRLDEALPPNHDADKKRPFEYRGDPTFSDKQQRDCNHAREQPTVTPRPQKVRAEQDKREDWEGDSQL